MKNKVFLDMDGVLVDFFGEIVKLAGLKSHKDLTVDDLFKVMTHQEDVYLFFLNLPEFKTNNILIDKIMKFTDNAGFYICSTPLIDDREDSNSDRNRYFIQQSIRGKHEWLNKHVHPSPLKTCFSSVKWKDAPAVEKDGTQNILIDDRQKNVDDWNNAGGIAIKFQADEHQFDSNLRFLDKEFEKIAKIIKRDKSSYNDVVESYLQKFKGV